MKNNRTFSWEAFYKAPIVGILRGIDSETCIKIAEAYLNAGLSTLEVTMNSEAAANTIARLRNEFPGLNIGAGTVCTMFDLASALRSGAQFIVTPILDEEVVKSTVAKEIPIFPGTLTPTEIYKAWSLGASAVKIFPATQFGVQYIRDISGPLDAIKVLPTGGVSPENIKSFFEAGAIGVGMGSSLLDKKLIQQEDFEGLKNHFIKIKTEIQDFTQSGNRNHL